MRWKRSWTGLDSWTRVHVVAQALSHGDQRLLEVAIALAAKPRLLFLDEPTAGMNPVEKPEFSKPSAARPNWGCHLVIVEPDMDIVFALSAGVRLALHRGRSLATAQRSKEVE